MKHALFWRGKNKFLVLWAVKDYKIYNTETEPNNFKIIPIPLNIHFELEILLIQLTILCLFYTFNILELT